MTVALDFSDGSARVVIIELTGTDINSGDRKLVASLDVATMVKEALLRYGRRLDESQHGNALLMSGPEPAW